MRAFKCSPSRLLSLSLTRPVSTSAVARYSHPTISLGCDPPTSLQLILTIPIVIHILFTHSFHISTPHNLLILNHRQTVQAGSRHSTGHRLWLGTTCLVGCALFGFAKLHNNEVLVFCHSPSHSFLSLIMLIQNAAGNTEASSPSSSTAWGEWKNSVMTNYENRIRSFSSPEKVFSVFASVNKDGHMRIKHYQKQNIIIARVLSSGYPSLTLDWIRYDGG